MDNAFNKADELGQNIGAQKIFNLLFCFAIRALFSSNKKDQLTFQST